MINRSFNQREKYLAAGALSLLLLAVFLNMILFPQIEKIGNNAEEIAGLSLEKQKALRTRESAELIDGRYLKLREDMISQAPPEEEVSLVLAELEGIIGRSNVQPLSIEPLPVKNYDLYREFTVEMNLGGDIAGLTRFLFELRNSQNRFAIDKITVNSEERSTSLKIQTAVSILLSGGPGEK